MSTVNTTDKTLTLKDGATVSYTIYNGDPESRKLPLILYVFIVYHSCNYIS